MPRAARRSAGTDACVMVAGWEMSVSTPPRLSASAHSRTELSSRRAASSDPRSNAIMPPNPRICVRGQRVLGMRRQARIVHAGDLRVSLQILRHGQAVRVVPFHPERQRLRAAQHQPRIERTEDRALRVLHERQPLDVVVARRHDDAADAVAVAVEIFRRAVHDEVGAELDGPLNVGLAKVLSTTSRRSWRRASAAAAARSVRRMTGLVGVSTNSMRVAGRDCPFDLVEIRGVDVREGDGRRGSAPCRRTGTCRRTCSSRR